MGKLKKLIGITLVMALMGVFLTGCDRTDNTDETSSVDDTSSSYEFDWTESDNEVFKQYKETYVLDTLYEKEYREAQSSYHKDEVTLKYAKIWQEKANEYFMLLNENICKDEIFIEYAERHDLDTEALEKAQQEWEEHAEKQIDYIITFARIDSTGSSNAAAMIARFEYDIYRNRAIQLYELGAEFYTDEPL